MELLLSSIQAVGMVLVAPLVSGVIKTTKAKLQNRQGPSLFQVYFDFIKLLSKDSVLSPTASWIFNAAPYIYFMSNVAVAALVPVISFGNPGSGDAFLLIYLWALGRFFLVLGSLDAGSAFGGMGGAREMFIAILVEPAMLLSLLTVAFKAKTTSLGLMVLAVADSPFSLAYVFAAIAFFMVLIAETGRIPVDNPDTHLELTMIHEGMILEYSGRRLALIFFASATKQLSMIFLFVVFFLPGNPLESYYFGWMLVKVFFIAILIAFTEISTNKMRLFKVPNFLAISCLLSLLALVAY
ncbi:respiratory chain complex I subunit 1 family protein [Pelosinus sp. sgz500959]|uniref:respiratory chain complex I subunit 1 family protein n=1 Tax=Pelosinus sp. sgz500959 TaxID=3242472 RepID=UPI00366B1BC3